MPNHLHDRFQVSAAVSAVRFSTSIRIETENGPGTEVDVEDDLGANRTVAEPRLAFRWNVSRKHSLEFGYQLARRDAERQITRDIEYQGEIYEAGLLVRTKFNSDLASLNWRWAFHSSDKSRIGATLGLGAILFRTGLDGFLDVNDQSAEVSTTRDLTAPVGAIGAFGQWNLSPKWLVELDVRALYIPVNRFEILVGDVSSVLRWFPLTWAGAELGLGFNSVRLDINEDPEAIASGDFSGQIKYRLASPRLGVVFTF